mgnify:CR=1 FL=1
MDNVSFGLLLRVYANKVEDIPNRVGFIKKVIARAGEIKRRDGRRFFDHIDVVVWEDIRYPDADCGLTAEAIAAAVGGTAAVYRFREGDIFVDILNFGVQEVQLRKGVTHTCILSGEAFSYLTQATCV